MNIQSAKLKTNQYSDHENQFKKIRANGIYDQCIELGE